MGLVLASMIAGVLLAMAWPVASAVGACRDDQSGLCGVALGVLLWVGCLWLALAWVAHALRLGWWFWGLVVAAAVVCAQLAIELVAFWPVALFLVLVCGAALLTDPGGTELPRWRRLLCAGLLGVVAVEAGVWAYLAFVAGP